MNKTFRSIGCASALALLAAACGANPGGGTTPVITVPSIDPTTLTNIENAVKVACQTTCAFAPTALTIAGIISANPAITTASQISAIICASVKAATTSPAAVVSLARKGLRFTFKRNVAAGAVDSAGNAILGTIVINGVNVPLSGQFVK